MATTPVPAFAAPPDFPALSDRATGTYNSKAYAWATAIQGTTGPNIHAIALTAKDNADDAALSTTAAAEQVVLAADQVLLAEAQALEASDQADRAQGMADAAAANAAYKGDWASLSGALAVPATVTHSGDRYVLLSNVANVAAHEPGVSAVWEKLFEAQEKLISGVNLKTLSGQSLLGGGDIAVGDVSGPAGAVNLRIAIFDGATGKSIKDGGKSLPASALVGLSDAQTLSGKTISFASNTLTGVQPELVSGSNIRTVNGTSLLGSGNVNTSSSLAKSTRTSNTALGVEDKGNLIFASASYTQTTISAASLGAGWWCLLRVDVGHATTLDPNGSELIDGQSTAVLQPGQTYLLTCTGFAFTLDRLGFGGYTEVLTSGTSWTCPGGVRTIKVTCVGGGGGGGGGHASAGRGAGGGGGGAVSAILSVAPGAAYSYAVGAGGPGGAAGVTGTGGSSTYWGASEFGGQGGYGGWVGGSLTSSLSDGGTGGGVTGANPFFARHGTAGTFGNASRVGTGGVAGITGGGYASGMGGNGGAVATGGLNGSQGCVIIEY